MSNDLPPLGAAWRDIARRTLPAFRRMHDQLEAAAGGPEQFQRLLNVLDQVQQERQHRSPFGECHCWCQVRGHPGTICTGDAAGYEPRTLYGELVPVPLCTACAAAIYGEVMQNG